MDEKYNERDMVSDAKKKLNGKGAENMDPLEKLRLKCLSRGVKGIHGFGRTFRIMDDNSDKKLDLSEFTKGVHDYGLEMEPTDLQAIFKALDTDGSGSLDFNEFLIALRPPMSKSRQELVQKAFRKMDKTGDGKVTAEDLKGVYKVTSHPKFVSGELTEEEIFKVFLKVFEVGGKVDGMVTEEEFYNYYSGVSASIDNDAYFDLMMRNSWKFDSDKPGKKKEKY